MITRRGIQIALGILWLLDGALQLQHQMFTSSFATQVIAPAAQGQPRLVSGLTHFAIHIFLLHPAVFNSFIAITQLGLGVLILWKQSAKFGLILSMIWGLFVWYVGEGAGGIFSGHTILLMGAPGAALLYSILALGSLPQKKKIANKQENKQPAYWLALVWGGLWVGGAIYQLLPGQNSVSALSSMIASNASEAPGWLASLDNHVASVINGFGTPTSSMTGIHMTMNQMARMQTQSGSGYWFIILLFIIQLFVGLAIFTPVKLRKFGIWLGITLLVSFWFIGQSLGGYFTGLATDPNAAPLFILLAIAVLSSSKLDQHLAVLGKRIENVLV